MDIQKAAEEHRAKELQKRISDCVNELKPILDKHKFLLGGELQYTSQGIKAIPVLIPKPDEGITIDTKEKIAV